MASAQKPAELLVISYSAHPVIDELEILVRKDGKRNFQNLGKSSAIIEANKKVEKFIVIYCLDDIKKLKDLLRVTVFLKEKIIKGHAGVFVYSSVAHPKLAELSKRMGCLDYQTTGVNARSLRLKIGRHFEKMDNDTGESQSGSIYDRGTKSGKALRVPSNEFPYDYWLYNKWSAFKKVMGQWIFEMQGPSPNVGRWSPSNLGAEYGNGHWMWVPHDHNHPLFKGQKGVWVFRGRTSPEFKETHWNFVSPDPFFAYIDDGIITAVRLSIRKDGNLDVANNSKTGEKLLPLIQKTHELEIRITGGQRIGASKEVMNLPTTNSESDMAIDDLENMIDSISDKDGPAQDDEEFKPFFDANGADENPDIDFSKADNDDKMDLSFDGVSPNSEDDNPFEVTNLFHRIDDTDLQENYLQEAGEQFKDSVMWTKGRKNIVQLDKIQFNTRLRILQIEVKDPKTNQAILQQIHEKKIKFVHFNVNLQRSAVFLNINTKFLNVKGGTLEYLYQEEMWQVQRRRHFRFEFSPGIKEAKNARIRSVASFEFDGKKTGYKLIDISAGGIRFYAPFTEEERWLPGAVIPSLSLSVGGKIIQCSGLVKWSNIAKKGAYRGKLQVGIEYQNLPADLAAFIDAQIMEEMNTYFKKYRPVDRIEA